MSFIDEVKNNLANKEELAKKEREEQFSKKQKINESFVRKLKQIIILEAKQGKEQGGVISGRMLFRQEILNDDSCDGYNWYGENCPHAFETFIEKQAYGFLKFNYFKRFRIVPSAQIICAYEYLKNWAATEKVIISDLYIYNDKNNKEILGKEVVLSAGVSVSGSKDQKNHPLPYEATKYYYAVNYKMSVNR